MPIQKLNQPAFPRFVAVLAASLLAGTVAAGEFEVRDTFENPGLWEPTDPTAWKVIKTKKCNV